MRTREQRAVIGKKLSAHCRARAIEMRKCEDGGGPYGEVHSYPLAVLDDFMRREGAGALFDGTNML